VGLKDEKLYATWVDGKFHTGIVHRTIEKGRESARMWMESKETVGKKVRMVEFKVSRVIKLKGAKR
jgi:hypothetical protein